MYTINDILMRLCWKANNCCAISRIHRIDADRLMLAKSEFLNNGFKEKLDIPEFQRKKQTMFNPLTHAMVAGAYGKFPVYSYDTDLFSFTSYTLNQQTLRNHTHIQSRSAHGIARIPAQAMRLKSHIRFGDKIHLNEKVS